MFLKSLFFVCIILVAGVASAQTDCYPREQAVEIASSQYSSMTKLILICIDPEMKRSGITAAYALVNGGLLSMNQVGDAITMVESFFFTLVLAEGYPTKKVNLLYFRNGTDVGPTTVADFAGRDSYRCAGKYTRIITALWQNGELVPARICSRRN